MDRLDSYDVPRRNDICLRQRSISCLVLVAAIGETQCPLAAYLYILDDDALS